jgi:hypothetical protein
VSELKEIKKDLGNYTENPDQYIQAFREVSQNLELSWKDVMLLLSQTLASMEKQLSYRDFRMLYKSIPKLYQSHRKRKSF